MNKRILIIVLAPLILLGCTTSVYMYHHAVASEKRELLHEEQKKVESKISDIKTIIQTEGDTEGRETALYTAASNGSLDLVKALVRAGANVNNRASDGDTPLFVAARNGQTDVCDYLIKKGASDLDFALCVAAAMGNTEICKMLMSAGASPEVSHYIIRWTPLHVAANNGHASVIKELIAHGAATECIDTNGNTPLCLAILNGHVDACKELLQNGANVNYVRRSTGWTPLHIAASVGNTDIYDVLVQAKADPQVKDAEGKTPCDVLRQYNIHSKKDQ